MRCHWLSAALLAALQTACNADPTTLGDGCQGLSLTATDPRATLPPTRVIVLTSDYQSGSAVSIDLATLRAQPLDLLVTGDTIGRVFGRTLALLNRSAAVADNVRFYDLSGASPGRVCERSLLAASELRAGAARPYVNAHDLLAIDAHRAYVTRWNLPSLAVFDLDLARVTATIDLSPFRGSADLPHADALTRVGSEVWVTLQRLNDLSRPTQRGLIVRLNPSDHRMLGTVELPHANPTGRLVPAPDGRRWWVVTLGDYHRADDGGIEEIDPDTLSVRTRLDERAVGGNIDGMTVLHDTTVLLRVSDARDGDSGLSGNRLVELDLAAPERTLEWQRSALWSPAVSLSLGGRVFVPVPGDERFGGTGVDVWRGQNDPLTPRITLGARMRPYDLVAAP